MKHKLLAMAALGFSLLVTACQWQNEQAREAEYDWSLPQVVYQQAGKIYFHDPATGKRRLLQEEDGEVFNLVFDEASRTLYYTVVSDGLLALKKATLANGQIQIQPLQGLDAGKEKFIAEIYGEYSPLKIRGEKLVLMSDFNWDGYGFSQYNIYSPAENSWTKTDDWAQAEKLLGGAALWEDDVSQPFEVRDQQLLYSGGKTQVPVSDKLDLKLDPEYGVEEIEYSNFSVSPDGSKVSFMALLAMGDLPHGPLCIANANGSGQRILVEDGMAGLLKPQWLGSALVFPAPAQDPAEDAQAEDEQSEPAAGKFRLMMSHGRSNNGKLLAEDVAAFTLIQGGY